MTEQPGLGEIGRSVARLENEIGHVRLDIKSLEDKVPTRELITAMQEAWSKHVQSVEDRFADKIIVVEARIDDLDAWKTWSLRLVVGAVIVALLAVVISTGTH